MKKLFCLFAFLLAGCSHYVTLHKQEAIAQSTGKLPLRAGLLFTESIIKDSVIDIDLGGEWNWIHLIHARAGNEIENAIRFAIESSVEYTTFLNVFPSGKSADSLDLIIIPYLLSQNASLWRSISNKYVAATFTCKVKLDIADRNGNIVDSIILNSVGVRGIGGNDQKKDSTKILDSVYVVADAADSALQNLRTQITYHLLNNNSLKKLSGSQFVSNLQLQTFPRYYGTGESRFELDTTSYEFCPLPNERRWSMWDEGHFMSFEPNLTALSINIDLLLGSHFSFRFGIGGLDYYAHGLDSFVFTGTQFQRVQTNDISRFDWILTTRASYLFFGPKHFMEVGFGMNTELGKWFTGKITVPNQNRFSPLGILGYRYQSIWFGMSIGASYTPYIDTRGFQHGFTFSAGYGY